MSDKPPTYGLHAVDDPEIIQHLGRIAASWATLDTILVETLCRLLRNDPAGEVIYYSLNNFRARLDIITNIVDEMMDPDDQRRHLLLEHLGTINSLSIERNEMIHSAMVERGDGAILRVVRRPGRKIPRRHKPVTANDLEEHGKALSQVAFQILVLINPQFLAGSLKAAHDAGEWADDLPSLETLQELLRDSQPLRPKPQERETEQTPPPQS